MAETSLNPDIQLNLHAPKYKLALILNSSEDLPSLDAFEQISLTNFLLLKPTADAYQRQGIYTAAVQFLNHDTAEHLDPDTSIPFTITYTTPRPSNQSTLIKYTQTKSHHQKLTSTTSYSIHKFIRIITSNHDCNFFL